MSLVLIGKDLVLEAKQRTNGFQVYIVLSKVIRLPIFGGSVLMQLYGEFLEEFLFLIMTWLVKLQIFFFNCSPRKLGKIFPIWLAHIFSDGLGKKQHQPACLIDSKHGIICHLFRFTLWGGVRCADFAGNSCSENLGPVTGIQITERQMMIGAYSHLQNAQYLGSMKPFSEGEPGSLGLG